MQESAKMGCEGIVTNRSDLSGVIIWFVSH